MDLAELTKRECERELRLGIVFRRLREIDAETRRVRAILGVKLDDTQKFGNELRELEGRGDRLPTEIIILKCPWPCENPKLNKEVRKYLKDLFEER